MKSGNLNFVESSGPLQACSGTALALYTRSEQTICKNYNDTTNNDQVHNFFSSYLKNPFQCYISTSG